jgi:serine/threonine-protein kinase RsbW
METLFELTIGLNIAEILAVSDRLEEALQANGFSAEEILDTQLAVEEAITNVIVHGYQKPGEAIVVSCQISRNRVEVQVADTAPRFDPLSVPEPELGGNVEDRRIGGLGVYLIRQIMDEVSYHYKNGRNCLVMIKRRKV